MAADLVGTIGGFLTPAVTHRASLLVGEDPARTQSALEHAVPAVLAGLIGLGSSEAGAADVAGWIQGQVEVREVAGRPAALFEGGDTTRRGIAAGQEILRGLFGERLPAVGDLVAGIAGVSQASALLLLGLASLLALGALHREAGSSPPRPADLAGMLRAQRGAVAEMAPPGLAEAMGLSSVVAAGVPVVVGHTPPGPTSPLAWVLPILLSAVLIGAFASLLRG